MPKPRSDLGKKNLISDNLIELRRQHNLSQRDLAHKLQIAGCTVPNLSLCHKSGMNLFLFLLISLLQFLHLFLIRK